MELVFTADIIPTIKLYMQIRLTAAFNIFSRAQFSHSELRRNKLSSKLLPRNSSYQIQFWKFKYAKCYMITEINLH